MSGDGEVLSQWLIVVRRDNQQLYETLRRGFEADGRVEVILDRRTQYRRGPSRPPGAERRKSGRRRSSSANQAALWAGAGFRMIHRDDGYDVYQAETGKKEKVADALQAAEGARDRDERLRILLRAALELLEER